MISKCLDMHVTAAYEVGNDQETVQADRNTHCKNRDGEIIFALFIAKYLFYLNKI